MTAPAKRNVLLSGGIGSGKSTVGALLAARGAHVIEADRIGHEVLLPSGTAFPAVRDRWPAVIGADGAIDRRQLGRIVFSDLVQLRELESMTHPAIRSRIAALAAAADAAVVVVEVPLPSDFMGDGWVRVVVSTDRRMRAARLAGRGLDPDEVAARMDAQPSDEEWRAGAEHVIDNNGDPEALEAQVDELWKRLS